LFSTGSLNLVYQAHVARSLLGEQIATKRKTLGLTQPMLARKARVGLSTLDALENGRLGELGYSKITNILTALGEEGVALSLKSA
jgi:predicted transcriptional regulator